MKQPSDSQAQQQHTAQVKARLFPAAKWAGTLEAWLERLPRQQLPVHLLPQQDLACINEALGEYRSLGAAPTFVLKTPAPLAAGWYYLETALTRNNGSRTAKLIAHTAEGSFEILVPSILRGTVREVFYLPQGVRSLSWQPTQAPGFLTQAPVLLHHIGPFESSARRIYRVVADLWRHRHLPPAARPGLSWAFLLGQLQQAYQASARLRIARLYSTDAEVFLSRQEAAARADTETPPREALTQRPQVSLLVPLKTSNLPLLEHSLESLAQQTYAHWECLVACHPGVSSSAIDMLQAWARRDPRVKLLFPAQALGDAGLLNLALRQAQGDWVMRLNPHDRLPRTALLHLVHSAQHAPQAQLIYGDDDTMDAHGQRSDPRYKPGWNPDLLSAHNYIGPAVAYRRPMLLDKGAYAEAFEGAEDHELVLRCTQGLTAREIGHIPKVIYHRSSQQASVPDAQQAHEAGRRALQTHLQAQSPVEVLDGPGLGMYRIQHALVEEQPLVSIIIPTRDKAEVLRACVQSIQHKTRYPRWEMLIVDNGSREPETRALFASLQADPRIRVLPYDAPFNYSAINNFAVQHAKGAVLALLNNDVEVIEPEWLQEMVAHAMRPQVGAVGAKLLYPDGTVQHAGVAVNEDGATGHVHRFLPADAPGYCHRAVLTQNVPAVTGACLVVQKQRYEQVGGLDEVHFQVAFNDIDFCLRLERAGYRNVFTPFALLYHHESLTRGLGDAHGEQAAFERKMHQTTAIDREFIKMHTNQWPDQSSDRSVQVFASPHGVRT